MVAPLIRRIRRTVGLLAILALAGCATGLRINDRPIPFSAVRVESTLDYIEGHYGSRPADISFVPRMIVLHWTAIDDLEECITVFYPEQLGSSRPDLVAAGDVNVSIHFLVDRDGTVYRLMPETWMARHVIGLNLSAIGVENVGGASSVDNLTRAQRKANVELVRYLAAKYPTIEHLIGHMEYRRFEGQPLWQEQDQGYRTDKVDPGDRFMAAVRARVADLDLHGPP